MVNQVSVIGFGKLSYVHNRSNHSQNALQVKKSGEKYFSPTINFTRLKLLPTKNFDQLFFLLNKNQVTDILKKYQIFYTIIWLSGVRQGRVVRKEKFKKKRKNESCRRFICLQKKYVLQSNFLERVLNFFYHVSGILNSFSNPCTSETIYCHSLSSLRVLYRSTIQFAFSCLITESLRETLTSAAAFTPQLHWQQ